MAMAVVGTPATLKAAVLGKPAASDQTDASDASSYMYKPPADALYDVTYAVESSGNTATSELQTPVAKPGRLLVFTSAACATAG